MRAIMPLAILALALPLSAQNLPEGEGKAEIEKLCKKCHDLAKTVSLRQDRNGWGATLKKMIGLGMKAKDKELEVVLDYLFKNFPAEELSPVNINKARAIQLESRLSLKRSEASAILKYRKEHGDFESFDDLKKVPGIDLAKLEAKKDRLAF